MGNAYAKISELNEDQKGHLAWRLDHKTYCGLITASHIARGDHGDLNLVEIFQGFDMKPHQAKIHARKVMKYKNPLREPMTAGGYNEWHLSDMQ